VVHADSLFLTLNGQLQATATGPVGNNNAFVNVRLPGPDSATATYASIHSTVGYTMTEAAGYSRLDLSIDEGMAIAAAHSQAEAYGGPGFTVAQGTPYLVDGVLTVPLSSGPAELHVDVSIFANPGGIVFRHATSRIVSPGSSIVVGQPISGDVLVGSPGGTLNAGVTYFIDYTILTTDQIVTSGEYHAGTVSVSLGTAPCYANCDYSTATPTLTANDFVCFLNRFAAGDSDANCDGSTTLPVLNANDFSCFLNAYAAGCP
jgi:hypothetical protein